MPIVDLVVHHELFMVVGRRYRRCRAIPSSELLSHDHDLKIDWLSLTEIFWSMLGRPSTVGFPTDYGGMWIDPGRMDAAASFHAFTLPLIQRMESSLLTSNGYLICSS